MKTAVVLVVVACCAVSALSLAEGDKKSKPPATESPAEQFSPSSTEATTSTTKPTPTNTTTTKPTPKPTTTTPKPTTPTPKPTTTTPKPTTPTPKPTTTTPKPTTTTPKPTTTTPKPTTTTAKPKTTTPKPTTTTPKPTTTTPKPTPKPTPVPEPTPPTNSTVGNYNVTKDNKMCLKAHMELKIRLVTPKKNGTFIIQPGKTNATGTCEETRSNLTLTFDEGSITFMFNKSVADNAAYLDMLSFDLTYAFSKGDLKSYSAKNETLHLFATKIGHSYSCKSESIYMGKDLYLDVNQDQMQAFNLTETSDFGSPDFCAADKPDYRVAIGVGVTLLVLIVVVVVAYMLSRRRRTDGYQTL